MGIFKALTIVVLTAAIPAGARAQSAVNLAVLQGLLPFSVLLNSVAGKAVLAANFAVTDAIQIGRSKQPALQSVARQREQALEDAFITSANARELTDGLGTRLGTAYRSLTSYTSTDDGTTVSFTSVAPDVETLIAYTYALTGADSNSAKYFFADASVVTSSGTTPASPEAADLLAADRGSTDVFGKAYHRPAGSRGADRYGDSRPFQTEHGFVSYTGTDYFGVTSSNRNYLFGPTQNLVDSPAFPSGHTTYGYTESLLLAIMLPERFSQMIARAAEYGNNRIILGAHYALDVIAGRTLASYDVAHLLANNPTYLAQTFGQYTVPDYRSALEAARADLRRALAAGCGNPIDVCARDDASRFREPARDEAFYESTQTYGLPIVYPSTARRVEDVAAIAPEAGYLLTAAFPALSLAQADRILTETEGPGGGFLDNGSAFGLYSRLDLYKAGRMAAAMR